MSRSAVKFFSFKQVWRPKWPITWSLCFSLKTFDPLEKQPGKTSVASVQGEKRSNLLTWWKDRFSQASSPIKLVLRLAKQHNKTWVLYQYTDECIVMCQFYIHLLILLNFRRSISPTVSIWWRAYINTHMDFI